MRTFLQATSTRMMYSASRTSFTGRTAGNVAGPGIVPGTFNGPSAITAGNFTFR